MDRFEATELRRFLTAVDEALAGPARIIVIGGSALALSYGVRSVTNDIDTIDSDLRAVTEAAVTAREKTGLAIPIQHASVAQMPPGYDARLQRLLPELERLEVWAVDAYDLVASKLLRGNDHDRQQLMELHDLITLELERVIERVGALLEQLVGDPTEPRWALHHFVGAIWGDLAADEAKRRVGG